MRVQQHWPGYGPLVVGATGGSGTRVIAQLLRGAGLYLGSRLNASEDSLDFGEYSNRWINRYATLGHTRLWPILRRSMIRGLNVTLERHLASMGRDPSPWGWKEPRSIYLLPFFHAQLPALRFLHVVRDGRGMAFSENQNQLRRHGRAWLNRAERRAPQPVRSITLWNRINLMAADYGESHMNGRYLRIRFEDLCVEPGPALSRVLGFAGLQADAEGWARRELVPPDTLGRWRREAPALVAELEHAGRAALQKFGYLES